MNPDLIGMFPTMDTDFLSQEPAEATEKPKANQILLSKSSRVVPHRRDCMASHRQTGYTVWNAGVKAKRGRSQQMLDVSDCCPVTQLMDSSTDGDRAVG